MKQALTFPAFCVALMLAAPAFAQSEKLGIAAVVNNDVITSSDVEGRFNMAIKGANLQPNAQEEKVLRKQSLEALIDEDIRIQEADRQGVTATKEEIDDAFHKVAEQNNIPADVFKKALMDIPGLYDSLLHQLKAQISWANVVKKKLRPQVNVTESDITSYMAEKAANPAKVEYNVAEIFMKDNDNNRKLAKQLIGELRNGQQAFPVAARQFSEGLEASKGGLLGWIPEHSLEPVLDDTLKKMKQGMISDAVISSRGIHILLLREKRDILDIKDSAKRVAMKQIVIPLPLDVPQDMADKALEQARSLQGEAKDCPAMDAVLKKVNNPMSRDMGRVRLSDLPSPVAAIVKDLPIGKISPPLRTNDSIGLFMVCDREESADAAIREDVANIIGNDRLTRLQYRYYRDLRAAAYVDIK